MIEAGREARERGREGGKRSGQVRRRLTLEDVTHSLPTLDTPERIRESYQVVQRWACAGLLSAGAAGAAVRACDGALKLYEATLDRDTITALEKRIAELETELGKQQRGESWRG